MKHSESVSWPSLLAPTGDSAEKCNLASAMLMCLVRTLSVMSEGGEMLPC